MKKAIVLGLFGILALTQKPQYHGVQVVRQVAQAANNDKRVCNGPDCEEPYPQRE